MTTEPRFADTDTAGPSARPLHLVTPENLPAWLAGPGASWRAWVEAAGFKAGPGEACLLPGTESAVAGALGGLGDPAAQARQRFTVAAIAAKLPAGPWRLETDLTGDALEEAALGWLLSAYRFTMKSTDAGTETPGATLVAPADVDAPRLEAVAAGEVLTRDLINTPANLMGPAELEAAARGLADRFGAAIAVTTGPDLLDANLPLIHTVGRASTRAPRLIDIRWGQAGPALTLVGKGVCFDTGGLNLKPGASMALMKKDMGGAAAVLGLAHMVMAMQLPLRLRVLIPAVENAVGGAAIRPGDILTARI